MICEIDLVIFFQGKMYRVDFVSFKTNLKNFLMLFFHFFSFFLLKKMIFFFFFLVSRPVFISSCFQLCHCKQEADTF